MSRFSSTVLCCAAVALVLASVSATTPMTWSSCSSAAATCKTLNVTMTPDPAVRGKTVTFSVTCDGTGPPVTGGTSKNVVYLFGIKVLSVTKELCSLTTCPIQPGVHTVTGVSPPPRLTHHTPTRRTSPSVLVAACAHIRACHEMRYLRSRPHCC